MATHRQPHVRTVPVDGEVREVSLEPSAIPTVDPRRLLILRLVARNGSLAAAARRLGWTQPAVSQQIRQLELDLGVQLVERTPRGVRLTSVGESVVAHAEAIVSRLSAVEREAAAQRGDGSQRIQLAAFPSASKGLVLPIVSDLATTRPQLMISLAVAEPDEARELLRAGDADLAIVFAYGPESQDAVLARRRLMTEPIRLVLPRDHPLAGVPELTLDQLSSERWISGCDRCRGHLLGACARAGFVPDVRHRLDDFVLVQHMVADGLGVALLPHLSFATFRHPGVAIRAIPGLGSREVAVELRADADAIPTIAALVDALSRAAAEQERAASAETVHLGDLPIA